METPPPAGYMPGTPMPWTSSSISSSRSTGGREGPPLASANPKKRSNHTAGSAGHPPYESTNKKKRMEGGYVSVSSSSTLAIAYDNLAQGKATTTKAPSPPSCSRGPNKEPLMKQKKEDCSVMGCNNCSVRGGVWKAEKKKKNKKKKKKANKDGGTTKKMVATKERAEIAKERGTKVAAKKGQAGKAPAKERAEVAKEGPPGATKAVEGGGLSLLCSAAEFARNDGGHGDAKNAGHDGSCRGAPKKNPTTAAAGAKELGGDEERGPKNVDQVIDRLARTNNGEVGSGAGVKLIVPTERDPLQHGGSPGCSVDFPACISGAPRGMQPSSLPNINENANAKISGVPKGMHPSSLPNSNQNANANISGAPRGMHSSSLPNINENANANIFGASSCSHPSSLPNSNQNANANIFGASSCSHPSSLPNSNQNANANNFGASSCSHPSSLPSINANNAGQGGAKQASFRPALFRPALFRPYQEVHANAATADPHKSSDPSSREGSTQNPNPTGVTSEIETIATKKAPPSSYKNTYCGRFGIPQYALPDHESKERGATELFTATAPKMTKKQNPYSSRPFNRYNIYFILERERIVQSKGGSTRQTFDPTTPWGYDDVDIPPLPPRFAHVKVPAGWYIPGRKMKKRQHRKSHGVASFRELATTIASTWRTIDDETLAWCTTVEKILKDRQVEHTKRATAAEQEQVARRELALRNLGNAKLGAGDAACSMSLEARVARQIELEAAKHAGAREAAVWDGGLASRNESSVPIQGGGGGGGYLREPRARVRVDSPGVLPMTSTTRFVSKEDFHPKTESGHRPFPLAFPPNAAAATGQLDATVATPDYGPPFACADSPLGGDADTSGRATATDNVNPNAGAAQAMSLEARVTRQVEAAAGATGPWDGGLTSRNESIASIQGGAEGYLREARVRAAPPDALPMTSTTRFVLWRGSNADTSGGATVANPTASSRSTSILDSVTRKIDLKILDLLAKKHPDVVRQLAMVKLQENIDKDPSYVFNMVSSLDGVQQLLKTPSQPMHTPEHAHSAAEGGSRYAGM